VSNEELRISFNIPSSMLWDYIGMGYFRRRIVDWDKYISDKILKDNHISPGHLSEKEKQLL
jgi:hypothetical protein